VKIFFIVTKYYIFTHLFSYISGKIADKLRPGSERRAFDRT